jgi:hypothetical protein
MTDSDISEDKLFMGLSNGSFLSQTLKQEESREKKGKQKALCFNFILLICVSGK